MPSDWGKFGDGVEADKVSNSGTVVVSWGTLTVPGSSVDGSGAAAEVDEVVADSTVAVVSLRSAADRANDCCGSAVAVKVKNVITGKPVVELAVSLGLPAPSACGAPGGAEEEDGLKIAAVSDGTTVAV